MAGGFGGQSAGAPIARNGGDEEERELRRRACGKSTRHAQPRRGQKQPAFSEETFQMVCQIAVSVCFAVCGTRELTVYGPVCERRLSCGWIGVGSEWVSQDLMRRHAGASFAKVVVNASMK